MFLLIYVGLYPFELSKIAE